MKLTPAEFLACELENGINADNPAFAALAESTAKAIKEPVISVLDFGAGTGVYSAAFHRAGYDVYAYEIWDEHKAYIGTKFPYVKFAAKPFTTDLMLFIEVAEHMTEDEIRNLFKEIRPKYILFSSTPHKNPGFDEDWGHINVQDRGYWLGLFEDLNYQYVQDLHVPTDWAFMLKLKG